MNIRRLKPTGKIKLSIVSEPAIELGFIALSKDKPNQFSIKLSKEVKNSERQIVSGVALLPGKMIERKDGYVYFCKSDVEQIAFNALQTNVFSVEHGSEELQDVYLLESWISRTPNELGIESPVGSWYVSLKVENNELWNKIKSKEYIGYSIEGQFEDVIEN